MGDTRRVWAIPMGIEPLKSYWQGWEQTTDFLNKPPSRVLLMGLAGSLSPRYQVGDVVIYQGCYYSSNSSQLSWQECDRDLTGLLQARLKGASLVRGLTSDRLIWLAEEKRHLGQLYQADVVDMEGLAVLEFLQSQGIAVGIIRVISDDSEQDLPNLNYAFSSDGSWQPFSLGIKMLESPLAAVRLIRGSLAGLKVLQKVGADLL
jgi:nucleoside phosphorylase